MSIKLEPPADTEIIPLELLEVALPSPVTPKANPDLTVHSKKKEYSIVGDGLYAQVSGDTTPDWLLSTIDIAINLKLGEALFNLDNVTGDLITAIDEIQLARNAYEEYINIDATVDRIIATRVQQLDARIDNANAKITEIDQAYVDEDQAMAIAAQQISASLNTPGGELNSSINRIDLALVGIDDTVAANYDWLKQQNEDNYVALAMSITEVKAEVDDVVAAVTEEMVAFATDSGTAGARYKINLKTDGVVGPDGTSSALIGGMVLESNGQSVTSGFDVDNFWLGRLGKSGKRPFEMYGNDIRFVGAISVEGQLFSHDFPYKEGNITGSPLGFRLSSTAVGTFGDPHIYGGYIRGAELYGGNMVGTRLSSADSSFVVDLANKYIYIR